MVYFMILIGVYIKTKNLKSCAYDQGVKIINASSTKVFFPFPFSLFPFFLFFLGDFYKVFYFSIFQFFIDNRKLIKATKKLCIFII